MHFPADTTTTLIPTLRYRNALAMIDWLCKAFGFTRHAVYADGELVHHAQLTFGNGMLMVGTASKGSAWDKHSVQPDEIGMRGTQGVCVIVSDPDAHYRQSVNAGAQILIEIADQDYGGRGYACRDPEGHSWWFGSYDPWKAG